MINNRNKTKQNTKRRRVNANINRKSPKNLKIIILILLIIVFIYSSYKLFSWVYDNHKSNSLKNELTQYVKPKNDSNENNINNNNNINSFSVDFNSLKEINKNIIGWITVNNTKISYPVVQFKNNSYYLNRDFKNNKNSSGAIFLDYKNDIKNLSKNTVIYGHNRLDESMFGSLKNTLNKNWYENKENKKLYVYTPDSTLEWEVFSIYKIKNEAYYITTSFTNDYFIKFIETIKKRSIYDFGVNITVNDKILTLSTCYGYNDYQRLVLHAKLVK